VVATASCLLRGYISETHFKRDQLGPRGLYLCVLVLGRRKKEKGRRRRRGSGRDSRLWKAISGEREITFSVWLPEGLWESCVEG
jgi:hypothetical protein